MSRELARREAIRVVVFSVLLATFSAVGASYVQGAEPPIPDRLKRQIGVMEKILDEVLVDSPNLLVYSHNAARGVYLDEFGVVFTLEASLVEKGEKGANWILGGFSVKEKDGKIVIEPPPDKDKDKAKAKEKDEDTGDEDSQNLVLDLRDLQAKQSQRDEALFEKGKSELVDTLIDYGETLTALDDNQYVAVAAFLKDSDYFLDNRISRLVIKVKMSDLRAYGAKRISRDTLRSRLVEQEY
jgi:hypothetical protein